MTKVGNVPNGAYYSRRQCPKKIRRSTQAVEFVEEWEAQNE